MTESTGEPGDASAGPGAGGEVTLDALRRLESPAATMLARLASTFEELQTVLRCCERLVSELGTGDAETNGAGGAAGAAGAAGPDDVVVEAVWTMALLSYARCFAAGDDAAGKAGKGVPVLTESDLPAQGGEEGLAWHKVLLQLRDHHADPAANPRERFSVGVAQSGDGAAEGIAITSTRQPLVDEVTVRQTGAMAFALSQTVNDRIADQQRAVFTGLAVLSPADLGALDPIEVSSAVPAQRG